VERACVYRYTQTQKHTRRTEKHDAMEHRYNAVMNKSQYQRDRAHALAFSKAPYPPQVGEEVSIEGGGEGGGETDKRTETETDRDKEIKRKRKKESERKGEGGSEGE